MKNITTFEWDYMYIFGPLTSTENINYITKSYYNGLPLFDDNFLLILVKEKKVIAYIRYNWGEDSNISITDKSYLTQLVDNSVCVGYHLFTPQTAIFLVSKLGKNHYSITQK